MTFKINSFQQPRSIMLSGWFLIYAFSISSRILLSTAQENITCSLPSNGKSGDKTRVKLVVYKCIQATSSSVSACGGQAVREVVLEKGKTATVSFASTDGTPTVLAKFFGDEVCVAYREEQIRKGTIVKHDFMCDSECFSDDEEVTYHSDFYCSTVRCGGTKKKFKFEVRDGAEKFVMRLSVLIGLAVSATGLIC